MSGEGASATGAVSPTLIDAHQHFWRFDPVRDAWITEEMAVLRRDVLPEELAPLLASQGIDGSVAVQADQSEAETRFLLELAHEHPFIRGVVGWVDLLAPDLEGRLEEWSTFSKLRGFRHIAQAEPAEFLAREDVIRGIGRLGAFGFTYDILVYPSQLPAALTLARSLPEQTFVLDHMAKPLIRDGVRKPWADQMRELATCPNVWCKVSGLVTEASWTGWIAEDMRPYLDVVFEAFGPRRLMFGSDWPVCLLAGEYREVFEVVAGYAGQLSPEERAWLFGGAATEAYGLVADSRELEADVRNLDV